MQEIHLFSMQKQTETLLIRKRQVLMEMVQDMLTKLSIRQQEHLDSISKQLFKNY